MHRQLCGDFFDVGRRFRLTYAYDAKFFGQFLAHFLRLSATRVELINIRRIIFFLRDTDGKVGFTFGNARVCLPARRLKFGLFDKQCLVFFGDCGKFRLFFLQIGGYFKSGGTVGFLVVGGRFYGEAQFFHFLFAPQKTRFLALLAAAG